jgi:hypothetical protein
VTEKIPPDEIDEDAPPLTVPVKVPPPGLEDAVPVEQRIREHPLFPRRATVADEAKLSEWRGVKPRWSGQLFPKCSRP